MDRDGLLRAAETETDPDALTAIAETAVHGHHPEVAAGLLHNPNLSSVGLETLAAGDDPLVDNVDGGWVLWRSHPHAETVDLRCVYDRLISPHGSDSSRTMIRQTFLDAVALHPNLSPEAAEFLADEIDDSTRKAVAVNPKTPPTVLVVLAQDASPWVRGMVASNRSATPEALRIVHTSTTKSHTEDSVAVAAHPNCPPDLLNELAVHDDTAVRKAVAANRNCSEETIVRLRQDQQPEVRRAAWRTRFSRTPPTR